MLLPSLATSSRSFAPSRTSFRKPFIVTTSLADVYYGCDTSKHRIVARLHLLPFSLISFMSDCLSSALFSL